MLKASSGLSDRTVSLPSRQPSTPKRIEEPEPEIDASPASRKLLDIQAAWDQALEGRKVEKRFEVDVDESK